MFGKKLFFVLVLSSLAMRLVAEDPLPVISGVTVVVETTDRGYVSSGASSLYRHLRFNFYIFVPDLALVFPTITSVKVAVAGGLEWTINKDTYSNLKAGYLGGLGSWRLGNAPWAIAPIDMKAIITFQDNRRVEKAFRVLPDPDKPAALRPLFLITDDFNGVPTPYHVLAPAPARIQAVSFEGDTIGVQFTVNDPRIRHGQIWVYDDQAKSVGSTPAFSDSDPPPEWLNAGQGFFNDGRVNTAKLPLALLKPTANANLSSVQITTWDEVDPQANLLRSKYLFVQKTGRWLLTPPGSALIAANPDYQASLASPPAAVPGRTWDEGARAAWAVRLEGVLGTLNGDRFEGLSPLGATSANRDNIDSMLSSSWGVVDKASLVDAMATLLQQGHRSRFVRQLDLIRSNPDATDQALAEKVAATEGWPASTLAFVRAFAPSVGDRGLLAWDLCRLIMLARDGKFLGYLTDDEAWSWINPAADKLREAYDSWSDLGESFLVGRMYWAGESRAAELYLQARSALVDLLKPDGEWGKTPWPPRQAVSLDYNPTGL